MFFKDTGNSQTIIVMVMSLFFSIAVCAHAEEPVKVIKIDPDAKAAVVKNADGDLKVVRQGDEVKPLGRITSISYGRIVLKNEMAEKVIITIGNGKQAMHRIGKIDRTSKFSANRSTTADVGGTGPNRGIGTIRIEKTSPKD